MTHGYDDATRAELITPGSSGRERAPELTRGPLAKTFHKFSFSFGHVFITHDRSALVLPHFSYMAYPPPIRTLETSLVSPALDRVLLQFEGAAICEVPDQGMFVTLTYDLLGGDRPGRLIAHYIDRTTGKPTRRIRLMEPTPPPDLVWANQLQPWIGAVYIPGHEVLLIPNEARRIGSKMAYVAYRCGPPGGASAKP